MAVDYADVIVVDVAAVARGYRMSRLTGSDVVNDRDEEIGTIDDVILTREDQSVFAVLQIGGFLGIGGRLVAVPFENLKIDGTNGRLKIVLPGATRESLKEMPEFLYRA